MACGAPVVTSTTGAAPEIAGGAAVLVDPFDVASIEAGLERAADAGEAARLRAMGHERARLLPLGCRRARRPSRSTASSRAERPRH